MTFITWPKLYYKKSSQSFFLLNVRAQAFRTSSLGCVLLNQGNSHNSNQIVFWFQKTNVSKDIILIRFPLLELYKHYMRSNTFWVITSVYWSVMHKLIIVNFAHILFIRWTYLWNHQLCNSFLPILFIHACIMINRLHDWLGIMTYF